MARILPGVRTLEETLGACPTCWMCRNICPIANLTGREIDTARGFALIARGVLKGRIEPSDDVIELLDRCVDCRQCSDWCVSGFTPWKAVQAARTELAARGRSVPALPAMPIMNGHATGEIVLLVGAAPPALASAAASLLRRVEPDVTLLHGDTGYVAWTLGLVGEAAERLSRTLSAVARSGCRVLVTLSPTDARMLADPPGELDLKLAPAVRVVELVDLLCEKGLAVPAAVTPARVAYHDACSAPRGTGREDRVRELLRVAEVVELPWSRDRALACGQGGGLPHTRPDLAGRLARARLTEAREAGAEMLVVDAPECAAHLAQHAAHTGLRVLSVYELLAEGTAP